jgi:hypothetical protein
MGVAKKMDMVSYKDLGPVSPRSFALNVYRLRLNVEQPDLMVVNFVLFKTLPNPDPVVVQREH